MRISGWSSDVCSSDLAYTYFGSKDHLVAEVFWRRLDAVELPVGDRRRRVATRVSGALRAVVDLIAGEPELASASTTAILADDADVQRLRDRIGGRIDDLLSEALGSRSEEHTSELQSLMRTS